MNCYMLIRLFRNAEILWSEKWLNDYGLWIRYDLYRYSPGGVRKNTTRLKQDTCRKQVGCVRATVTPL
jgi:hypothetical protein